MSSIAIKPDWKALSHAGKRKALKALLVADPQISTMAMAQSFRNCTKDAAYCVIRAHPDLLTLARKRPYQGGPRRRPLDDIADPQQRAVAAMLDKSRLTYQQAADLAGVSARTLYHMRNGLHQTSPFLLYCIEQAIRAHSPKLPGLPKDAVVPRAVEQLRQRRPSQDVVASAVADAVLRSGMTTAQIAARAGLDPHTVAEVRGGNNAPKSLTLSSILEAIGATITVSLASDVSGLPKDTSAQTTR